MEAPFVGHEIVNVVKDSIDIREKLRNTIQSNPAQKEGKEPFMLVDLGDVLTKHQWFLKRLPRVQPFYAMKCNPDPMVTSLLAQMGVGMDCASKSEIRQALESGVDPKSIIYANTCKQESQIRYALSCNVDLMTFDCVEEMEKIFSIDPKARLVLRLNVDSSWSKVSFGKRNGAQPEDIETILCRAQKLGLKIVGVSFHVGGDITSTEAFAAALRFARRVFDMATEIGIEPFTLLDIGGGFPGTLGSETLMDTICADLNKGLDALFPDSPDSSSKLRIIAEPGRYYVASACTSAANIITVRSKRTGSINTDPDSLSMCHDYFINDGIFGSFLMTTLGCISKTTHCLDASEGQLYPSCVLGPTCAPNDVLERSIMLPKMNVGDWMYFPNMGAYTSATRTLFHGFGEVNRYYVIAESALETLGREFGSAASHLRATRRTP